MFSVKSKLVIAIGLLLVLATLSSVAAAGGMKDHERNAILAIVILSLAAIGVNVFVYLDVVAAVDQVGESQKGGHISDFRTELDYLAHFLGTFREKYFRVLDMARLGQDYLTEASKQIDQFRTNLVTIEQTIKQRLSGAPEILADLEGMRRITKDFNDLSVRHRVATAQLAEGLETVERNTLEATKLFDDVVQRAQASSKAAQVTAEGIDHIQRAMTTITRVIGNLGSRLEKIGGILEAIGNVAEQTNLLALNAAIEAARAGKHGSGFAVVADEVRKLSESSHRAAMEIRELIEGIRADADEAIHATHEGTQRVEGGIAFALESGRTSREIIEIIEQVESYIDGVGRYTLMQKTSSHELLRFGEEINGVSDRLGTASAEEMETASKLREELTRVRESVDELKRRSTVLEEIGSTLGRAYEKLSATRDI
ncbi:MAG: hypothetical protein HY303_19805 [Candidatus Wallbacteria bacterium]|nr:hypothetical protein [Candidatus Wallbacteria bacterium]